jgi:hypothetical protein
MAEMTPEEKQAQKEFKALEVTLAEGRSAQAAATKASREAEAAYWNRAATTERASGATTTSKTTAATGSTSKG